MLEQLIAIGEGAVFAVIVLAWLWVAKLVADRRVRGDYNPDEEIEQASNLALGLRRAGLYLGVAIGMLGALDGGGGDFQSDVTWLLVDGAALTLLMGVARLIADVVVIPGVKTDDAIRDRNHAVGAAEFGIFVATGLIANGSFAGEGGGLASALLFFALGQLALLVMVRIYEAVTPWRVIDEITRGNAAAGLLLAGTLVAFGFILRASLSGPFIGWTEDLLGFGFSALVGMVFLVLLQLPIDRLFLPGTSLHKEIEEDGNVAAIAVAAAVKVALALIIAAVMI